MAEDFNPFGTQNTSVEYDTNSQIENNADFVSQIENTEDTVQDEEPKRTYSNAELKNPQTITVDIQDKETPILVLFGPPAVGKTMTLIRLAQYLDDHGFTIKSNRSFRPSYDENYTDMCEKFNDLLYDRYAAEKTDGLNFMLLYVYHNGRPILQILEAPGEHYYNPNDRNEPKGQFLPYIQNIINSKNRKIWLYLTEPDWKDREDRTKYAKKIFTMKRLGGNNDKSIILFNKVDKKDEFFGAQGNLNIGQVEKYIKGAYPSLLESFKNTNPITSLWKPFKYIIVPFQTGTYEEVMLDNKLVKSYTKGNDKYPAMLWECIRKIIKG